MTIGSTKRVRPSRTSVRLGRMGTADEVRGFVEGSPAALGYVEITDSFKL